MILHGRNLIISADGSVLAASKSCTLDVQSEAIKVSSPTDGQWEHVIAGMKSWSLSTNHLMPAATPAFTINAFAQANNGATTPEASFVSGTNTVEITSRGLSLIAINPDGGVSLYNTYDTFNNMSKCNELSMAISNTDLIDMAAIVSYDAFGMNNVLRETIESKFKVDMSSVPTGSYRGALAIIGGKTKVDRNPGIIMYRAPVNYIGGSVRAKLAFDYDRNPVADTPLRNAVDRVGQMFDISVQVDGLGSDRLTGKALCTVFQCTATLPNLMQGSFKWLGNGPLE